MKVTICKSFTFCAAHKLDRLPRRHKCHNLHGHGYQVDIEITGDTDDKLLWLVDYCVIAEAWKPLHNQLDHKYLNDVDGIDHSTTEVVAGWIFDRISLAMARSKYKVTAVRVHEKPGSTWAEVRP